MVECSACRNHNDHKVIRWNSMAVEIGLFRRACIECSGHFKIPTLLGMFTFQLFFAPKSSISHAKIPISPACSRQANIAIRRTLERPIEKTVERCTYLVWWTLTGFGQKCGRVGWL